MNNRVTRKDVATLAGVSETIVSYVLNKNRYVDSTKKERVLSAVRQLGYVPNPVARALKGKEAHHILFIVDDLVSEYFGSIIRELEALVVGQGYLFSLTCDRGDKNFVTTVENWSFDGIVIGSATISTADIQRIIDTGMPTVILSMNEYPRFKGRYGLIFTGLMEGSLKVMDCLKKRGRKRIAFVDAFNEEGSGVDESGYRYKGYVEGLEGGEKIIIDHCRDSSQLKETIGRIYRESHFDALFCRTDRIAAESLMTLASLGVRVPEDVSVVGVNNSRIALYSRPRLTSLAIRVNEVAKHTLELFSGIKRECGDEVLSVHLETDLIERESV